MNLENQPAKSQLPKQKKQWQTPTLFIMQSTEKINNGRHQPSYHEAGKVTTVFNSVNYYVAKDSNGYKVKNNETYSLFDHS